MSATVGVIFIKSEPKVFELSAHPVSKKLALTLLGFLILLLAFSPFFINDHALHLEPFGNFVQIGSLVFGGGHVILPLLQSRILSAHLLSAIGGINAAVLGLLLVAVVDILKIA